MWWEQPYFVLCHLGHYRPLHHFLFLLHYHAGRDGGAQFEPEVGEFSSFRECCWDESHLFSWQHLLQLQMFFLLSMWSHCQHFLYLDYILFFVFIKPKTKCHSWFQGTTKSNLPLEDGKQVDHPLPFQNFLIGRRGNWCTEVRRPLCGHPSFSSKMPQHGARASSPVLKIVLCIHCQKLSSRKQRGCLPTSLSSGMWQLSVHHLILIHLSHHALEHWVKK